MRKTLTYLSLAALFTLTACSSEEPSAPPTTSATIAPVDKELPTAEPVTTATVPEPEETQAEEDRVEIAEAGVGQRDGYAWAAALVTTRGHVGESLTVHFNLFDDAGELVGSGDQVTEIVSEESSLAIGTQVEVGDQTIARVDATFAVDDYGVHYDPLPALAPAPATIGEYSMGSVRLNNDTDQPWRDVWVGIICRDASGAIVGGGDAYPELVPANAESMADAYVIAASSVTECTGYPAFLNW